MTKQVHGDELISGGNSKWNKAVAQMGVGQHQKPSLTSVADALQIFPRTADSVSFTLKRKTEMLFCSTS